MEISRTSRGLLWRGRLRWAPLVAMVKKDASGPKRFAPFCNIYLAGNPLGAAAKGAQVAELRKLVKKVVLEEKKK